MPTALRNALSWLLAALLIAGGVPAAVAAPAPCAKPDASAQGADGPRSCCERACCCRLPVAPVKACGCEVPPPTPKAPAPAPQKQPLQGSELQPTRSRAPPTPPAVRPHCAAATSAPRTLGPLPHRSRQEALSVWRF